jgi:hypothetical protein
VAKTIWHGKSGSQFSHFGATEAYLRHRAKTTKKLVRTEHVDCHGARHPVTLVTLGRSVIGIRAPCDETAKLVARLAGERTPCERVLDLIVASVTDKSWAYRHDGTPVAWLQALADANAYTRNLRAERSTAALLHDLSGAPFHCRNAEALRSEIRAAYDACEYRRARGKWAGGEHSFAIHFGDWIEEHVISHGTETAWSRNGKWSGKNSRHAITASRHVLVVRRLGMMTARSDKGGDAGLALVLRAKPECAPGVREVAYVAQAAGTAIKLAWGYASRLGGYGDWRIHRSARSARSWSLSKTPHATLYESMTSGA